MTGLIALVGSGEYLPVMQDVDRFLLARSGAVGRVPRVVCLATAAGQEGERSWGKWLRMGEQHFQALGTLAAGLPIVDRASAEDPAFVPQLEGADLIYFSGGNPQFLVESLQGTRAWRAVLDAWGRGAVLAGCSAGAMILAGEIPNFRQAGLASLPAFGLLPVRMVLPHFDRWRLVRGAMLGPLKARLKDSECALGIDEETGLVGPQDQAEWLVLGRQTVSVITRRGTLIYRSGERVVLP